MQDGSPAPNLEPNRLKSYYAGELDSATEPKVLNGWDGSSSRKSRHGCGWGSLRLGTDGKAFSPGGSSWGQWVTGRDGSTPFWIPGVPWWELIERDRDTSTASVSGIDGTATPNPGSGCSDADDPATHRKVPDDGTKTP